MNSFENIKNLADISFIDNRTLEEIVNEMKNDALDYLNNVEGIDIDINKASELNAEINACATQIYQMENYIDRGAKQNLLKYSYGDFLDNLGANSGLKRNDASKAVTTIKFSMNDTKTSVVSIVRGTKVSDGSGHIFKTDEYVEIAIGEKSVSVSATATEAGSKNNDIQIGKINVMVEPIQYIDKVENTDVTSGGAEVESDDDFAERIYLAPSDNTKTGSEDGYRYNVKSYSSAIGDIKVISTIAGQVNIYFLLNDGSLPTSTLCQEVYDYLADSRRAMTDYVIVSAPTEQEYNIALTYYIEKSQDSNEIQKKVNAAVDEFVEWQRAIGKDINNDKLTQLVLNAGAKRVVITSPTYTTITNDKVGKLGTKTITFGGAEDD